MGPDQSKERENRRSISWYSMVRPGSEVELSHLERLAITRSSILKKVLKKFNSYHEHILYHNHKFSDCVVCQNLLVSNDDMKWSVALVARLWPVLFTLVSTSLLTVGEHDYCRGSLLPHHPPEVNQSVGKGAYL